MDAADKDWKKTVGFPINYDSGQDSDDDEFKDVVVRHPRSSRYLLADEGDGSEADQLGTTPPRSRIRNKEKRRAHMDSIGIQRDKRQVTVHAVDEPCPISERHKKRASLKLERSRDRLSKADLSQAEPRADSLPSPNPALAVPTLVESCRFMSLCSRPRSAAREPAAEPERRPRDRDLPASRLLFHNTFCMLINMGNADKTCRRTISREEKVWQNELKDLIWLELQAKIAGRTLEQQDGFLCAQRDNVPALINNILEYRFVNYHPCKGRVTTDPDPPEEVGDTEEDALGCLAFTCSACWANVGRGLREVGSLLDALHLAEALYPSSQALRDHQPRVATPAFQDRVKAMCLWFNTVLHMRLKMIAVASILRSVQVRSQLLLEPDSDVSRQSSVHRSQSDISTSPSDTAGSEWGAEPAAPPGDESGKSAFSTNDDDDSGVGSLLSAPRSTAEAQPSGRQRKKSLPDLRCFMLKGDWREATLSELPEELAQLHLLGSCQVSPYRDYHREKLKTQGVRRSMQFVDKMRRHLLSRVFHTLERPEVQTPVDSPAGEVFADSRLEEDADFPTSDDERLELRRYGSWSPECEAMRLPSYRSHFLLLACICMEAVHDYLAFTLDARPDSPCCLTIKQLIHELKEGLDMATEMRWMFVRHVRCALAAPELRRRPRPDLLALLTTYDNTVGAVLTQYLSYLRKLSVTEHLGRARLQSEWRFTARLAARAQLAASLAPPAFTEIICNQLNRLLKQFEEKFKHMEQNMGDTNAKHTVYALCRTAQGIFASEREATLQAAQWARALAARLARAANPLYLTNRADIFNALMLLRDFIVNFVKYVLEHSQRREEEPREAGDSIVTRVRELLLQIYKLGFEIHKELHRLMAEGPRAGAGRALLRAESVLDEWEAGVLDERLDNMARLADTQTESLEALLGGKLSAGSVSASSVSAGSVSAGSVSAGSVSAGSPSADSAPDAAREEQQWAKRVARAVVEFACCWMKFVVERCDRGRGLRPRWASQGLEFLTLACDPCNTRHLSDEEFEDLKQLMDGCISHVIGSRPLAARAPDAPAPPASPRLARSRFQYSPQPSQQRGEPAPPSPPSPPSPPADDRPVTFQRGHAAAHSARVAAAVSQLDAARDAGLRAQSRVGRVLEAAVASYEPKLRQLTFKWQRGLKIGQGTFGKVYTVVNTESGQLLAMKELSIGVNDRRAFQRAANELRVLEGVIHPHLVRYYGCELHREQLLIFMELCVEGSLEALVATAGALSEPTVRRYSAQLLDAVRTLHARSIVHRDIKSGNIFLTHEGHCLKLGDFGCAVKIRANTTAPNEVQGFVGTQAYMAPEVFMRASGHGRGADVWSLGCVVTEMASGKRPFWDYDSNYQIMFMVGTGARPHVPEHLSAEGQDFCLACLTHEAELRPRADQLASHIFLKLNPEEECECKPSPSFLMT